MRAAPIVFLICCAFAAPAAVSDQALRYVNGEIVTMSDVRLRVAMRTDDFRRQGKVLPQSREETIAFMQKALESLTDETLMVQKAKELKLIPDHDRIASDVRDHALQLGQGLSLAEQARARRQRERDESIAYLLDFYDYREPDPTPARLVSEYRKRQDEFHRPARARVLTILLRPSDPSLGKDLRRAKADLFRRAQDAPDAEVAKAATSRADAVVADDTTPEQREHLIDECVHDLAQAAAREDLDDKSRAIARSAKDLEEQAASIRDLDQTVKALEQERAQLDGKTADDFKAAAKRISQGPNAAEGGEQGWVEPGTFPSEVDQRVFSAPVGSPSAVFTAANAAWLVFVQEREDARTRSFDEVAGELTAALRRERREALRDKVCGILRSKATITDVAPVSSLLE
jgi:parvulin-like peptidyl-prolyl isomerase